MKNLLYSFVVIAVCSLGFNIKGCFTKAPLPIVQIKTVNDTMTYFFDKDSLKHARLAQEIDNRDRIIAKYSKQIKSQAKRLKIQADQITEQQNEIAIIKGQFTTGITDIPMNESGDNCYCKTRLRQFHYEEQYLQESGIIDNLEETVVLNYSVEVPLSETHFNQWKHHSWLARITPFKILWNKKILTIDVSSVNPNVTISGLTNYKIN